MENNYWYVLKRRLNVDPIPEVNYEVVFAEEGVPEKDRQYDVISKHKHLRDVELVLAHIKGGEYTLVKRD